MYLVCVSKTNTNNNTSPVIQLHSNKAQPIFAKSSIHCGGDPLWWRKWLAVGKGHYYKSHEFKYHWRRCIFHRKDFKSSETQLILLSRLAYGLGYVRLSFTQLPTCPLVGSYPYQHRGLTKRELIRMCPVRIQNVWPCLGKCWVLHRQ